MTYTKLLEIEMFDNLTDEWILHYDNSSPHDVLGFWEFLA